MKKEKTLSSRSSGRKLIKATSKSLDELVENRRNSLKSDRLDMSFGELMNVFEDGELIITPEYQRAFRWQLYQQTRFIESVLLGIPIPPIFVAEDSEGKWELVDGLQRISTIFSFFGLLVDQPTKNNLVLLKGDLVEELEGLNQDSISVRLKTSLKRSVCRVEIVRWNSKEDVRYELFNRLNTGASPLSDQEVRNCIFRSYSVDLNSVLRNVAAYDKFVDLISPSEARREQMFLEELVLRFFAFRHLDGDITSTVPQYLTEFMKKVSEGKLAFDLKAERGYLVSFVDFLSRVFGSKIFRPRGSFALHLFDSMAYAVPKLFRDVRSNEKLIQRGIEDLVVDDEYQKIGTATFSNSRIKGRMNRALEVFKSAQSR